MRCRVIGSAARVVMAVLVALLATAEARGEEARGPGLQLPGGWRAGGRFDLAYERVGLGRDATDARHVLRNYHHFVFLTRQTRESPMGFSAELVDLSFYEITARVAPKERPYRFLFRAGRILVPFGPDPLFHKSYGGVTGFDQRFLPVVWAQHGAAAGGRMALGRLAISNDLYAVQGHALGAAAGVLDLQKDLSPLDRARIAFGDRLAIGFGPATLWYSIYVQTLGFGRRLILQALDAEVWRIGLPVLDRLAAGVGLARADVSGGQEGGPGRDYYHVADYAWLRVYAFDWLYLQARSGLQTFDNRRGTFLDESRLDARDVSRHNLAVVAQRWGATASLGYYFAFEKADEIPDDFLRLLVSYDF